MHARVRACIRVCVRACMQVCACIHMRARVHVYARTCASMRVRVHVRVRACVCARAHACVCTHARMRACTVRVCVSECVRVCVSPERWDRPVGRECRWAHTGGEGRGQMHGIEGAECEEGKRGRRAEWQRDKWAWFWELERTTTYLNRLAVLINYSQSRSMVLLLITVSE